MVRSGGIGPRARAARSAALDPLSTERAAASAARFLPGGALGHYESWFQRANHPSRPLAFWIRYTIFCPRGRPGDALGELWAIFFDGETGRITAAKQELPIARCSFSTRGLDVRIGEAALSDGAQHGAPGGALHGAAASRGHRIDWQLSWAGGEPPLWLLPRALYTRGFPRAKALVPTPNAVFDGWLECDGERTQIAGWRGSQNHNWGSRHTDRYAWGQVAGFDDAPDVFLECSTARVKVGPLSTPWLTFVVLRAGAREWAINGLLRAARARARVDGFSWSFDTLHANVRIRARLEAPAAAFVGLRYANPPGGEKICLNTKLARAELVLEEAGRSPRTFRTAHRAAFEILTDERESGIPIVA